MDTIAEEAQVIKNKKIRSYAKETALIVGILLVNAVVYGITGYGIPCIFRLITGFKCPGCGLTHAYIELFKGNLGGAIDHNILSVTLLPIIGIFLLYKAIILLRTGDISMKKWENVLLILCGLVIAVFFVYRNIPIFFSHPLVHLIVSK